MILNKRGNWVYPYSGSEKCINWEPKEYVSIANSIKSMKTNDLGLLYPSGWELLLLSTQKIDKLT